MSSLIVKGPHLTLLPYQATHADKMFEWFYGAEYQFFFRENLQVIDPSDFETFHETSIKNFNRMTLLHNASKEPIGHMTFNLIKEHAEIYNFGILIDKQQRGKVFCIEGCVLMMELLFRRLGAHKMTCEVLADDKHLNRIIKLGGFSYEGTFKDEALLNDKYYDENRYAIFKERFEEYYGDFVRHGVMNNPQITKK